jgi:VWFA-related protein
MKYWLLVTLAAALVWTPLLAQDSAQQQLPTAPSAVKYPPPAPSSTDTPSGSSTQPGAAAPPAANPGPSAQSAGVPNDSPQSSQSSPPQAAAKSEEAVKPNQSPAGASGTSSDDSIPLIRKRVDEVNVVFTVTDKRDHFVNDLSQKDFRVIDDNKPALSIESFSRETNLPLRVGLLIDASNSVRDRFRFEQESAIEFLDQIIRPRYDKAFVIGFDTTPEVTQDFTDSTEALSRGVRVLRAGGGTALYDAVYYACRDKLMNVDRGELATRRAIILLSDGDDNQSRVSLAEAADMAQRAEVIIYTISTNTSGVVLRGDKVLKYLAEQTGGRAFFPFKIEDVANAFTQISEELRSQYDISYKPADFVANGKYRKIEILADNKKYHVRARKGYYAPRQ